MSPALDPLYLITDRRAPPSGDLLDALAAALDGGARLVQFREKDLPPEERLRLGERVAALAEARGARVLVNGDLRLAEALGAAGLHLGKGTVSVRETRARGYRGLIGYSAHSGAEAAEALAGGADFATLSPVFPARSKFSAGPALGLAALGRACAACEGAVYALGGVDAGNAAACLARGAHGVALVGAILGAADPARAARETLEAISA